MSDVPVKAPGVPVAASGEPEATDGASRAAAALSAVGEARSLAWDDQDAELAARNLPVAVAAQKRALRESYRLLFGPVRSEYGPSPEAYERLALLEAGDPSRLVRELRSRVAAGPAQRLTVLADLQDEP
jgi:hypothetical protein